MDITKNKICRVLFVFLFVILLYLLELFIQDKIYLVTRPLFLRLTSFLGLPEWGRPIALHSSIHLLLILTCLCSLFFKNRGSLLIYACLVFLSISYTETLVFMFITASHLFRNFKSLLFYLIMFAFGLSICLIFLRIQKSIAGRRRVTPAMKYNGNENVYDE